MMFQNWNVLLHRLGEIPGVEPVTHPQADAALVEDARLKARLESHCVKHLLGAEGMTDAGDTRVIHLRKRFQVVHAARSVESRFTQTGPARSPLSKFLRLQFRISSLHDEAFRAERDVATADQFQGQGQLRTFSQTDRLSKGFLGCLMEDDDCGSLLVLLKPFGKEQVCPNAVIALTDKTDQLPNVVGFNFTRLRLDVYDGRCGLCHRMVGFLVAEDPTAAAFRCSLLGRDTFRNAAAEADGPSLPASLVLRTADGTLLTRSAAVIHILKRLGGVWRL